MADVTISALTPGTPAGNNLVPYSTGSVTLGVPVSAMFHNAGNIGIGTNNPQARLDVNGEVVLRATGTEGGQLRLLGPDNATTILVMDTLTNVGRVFTVTNNAILQLGQLTGTGGSIKFYTETAERMRIDANGNVGIGTEAAAPQAKLHVNGDIKCTSTVINGVRTMYFSGLNNGNQTISCAVYLNQGNPVKVQCSFNHWSQPEYNATRESYIGVSHYAEPYVTMFVDDILNKSSALGGGWSFSRPVTNANPGPGYSYPISDKLVITKSAGTYVGPSHWWIKIEGNAVSLGAYPA